MGSADELMFEAREQAADARIADYLKLTLEEYQSMDVELEPQTSNDDSTIGYYFEVPEGTSADLLQKLGCAEGEAVYLPMHLLDEPDDYED